MKDEDIILSPGDKIHFITYFDHSTELNEKLNLDESLKKLKKNPHVLWTVGKIIKQDILTDSIIVICSGALNRFKKPYNYETVLKSAIISMQELYTIP